MGAKIITKTDRQMEDRMLAVANDAERADTLAKARAFPGLAGMDLAKVVSTKAVSLVLGQLLSGLMR